MKLLNILVQEDSFKTIKTDKDAQTGTITWDVEYTPLVSLDKNMQKMYNDFVDVIAKHPDDVKLQQLFSAFADTKRNLRTHITRKYKK